MLAFCKQHVLYFYQRQQTKGYENMHLNWLAIAIAIIASMILAKTWFTPKTFGNPWRKYTGITPADSKKAGKMPIVLTAFANIITVIVLAIAISVCFEFFQSRSIWLAAAVGFVTWLAFSATTLITHNAFEQKPSGLTLINNGYQLTLFLLVSVIIGAFGV
jgi:hypothetical protein